MTTATGRDGHGGVAAIVLAAGGGRRMTAPMNKVFLQVDGKPILARTLELFEQLALVDEVVLVAAAGDREACERLVAEGGYGKVRSIVIGGPSRHASEFNGLLALEEATAAGRVEIVLVHDAVRPFVAPERIEALVAEARRTGAAILAIPAGERLVMADEDGILEDGGDDLWVAQTPQAFRAPLVLEAHRRAADDGFVGTDTAAVVERMGVSVAVVRGEPENLKITTSDDLLRAELIAEARRDGWTVALRGSLTTRV